jgi:hypothetical protein
MLCLLLVASLLAATFSFGGRSSSAQSTNAQPNNNGKDEDELTKALKKNWDKLPPQAKLAADPKAKEAWERLTPKQQAMLKRKVHELLRTQKEKFDKEKQSRQAGLKTWDDVNKGEGPNKGEEATLTYVDNSGNRHSFKAKRRDGSVRPQRGGDVGAAQGRKGGQAAGPDQLGAPAKGFTAAASPRPAGRAGRPGAATPWQENWAFDPGGPDLKRPEGFRYARAALATGLAPQAGCTRGPEQFIRNFYEKALARQPNPSELSYWLNAFAWAQGQGTLISTARDLGSAIFLSQDYANRGRSNYEFVYDAYRAYLFRDPEQAGWDFWTGQADAHGQAAVVPGFGYSIEFHDRVSEVCNVSSFDGDNDALPDNFENALADGFTPAYHVSQFEPDQYATFENSPTLTIKQRHGQTPVSHFRVLPLFNPIRFNPNAGRWESLLRIDYLSLWDHDSGFVGELCALNLLEGGGFAHELDGERSAMLVSAPAVCDGNGCGINLDPNAYSALSVYTAAHEGTTFDHSDYWDFPNSPRPVGTHLDLWQSLQKHSTYTFNPDYSPIVTIELQVLIFVIVEYLFYRVLCWGGYDPFWDSFYWDDFFGYGWSPSCEQWWYIFIAVNYYIVTLLYVCLVERFHEQGAALAPLRINVGEPSGVSSFGIPGGQPLNGSAFVNDNSERAFHLYEKLIEPLRFESLIQ